MLEKQTGPILYEPAPYLYKRKQFFYIIITRDLSHSTSKSSFAGSSVQTRLAEYPSSTATFCISNSGASYVVFIMSILIGVRIIVSSLSYRSQHRPFHFGVGPQPCRQAYMSFQLRMLLQQRLCLLCQVGCG